MSILEPYSTAILMDEQSFPPLREALFRYCLSLTRSRVEAEDLAQDTWTKTLAYKKFADSPNPEALLLRIAKNTWIDAMRRKTSLGRMLEHTQAVAALTQGQMSGQAPESGRSEIELAFQALIRHLSPLQRTVFVMRDVLDYPAGETAEMLGTTEGAVKAALHRARQALGAVRKELAEDDGPAQPQDLDFRILLQALAESYEKGQLPVMLELLRRETAAEMTMAVSSGTVQMLGFGGGSSGTSMTAGGMSGLRMAA
ncbi:RNA polymerase sigma factor [Paenibacillus sonchi]|uniref:RNA polymerase sigma factor n=2 Tax=Paenibacillus sonchi TaxID=373687 RepID=UPI00030EB62E|nr:RNA polymerase sigma factor [Paenibacillus sonchi]MCE3200178.1 RNA polymerase sigma factor [Paenibacillus sonchi]